MSLELELRTLLSQIFTDLASANEPVAAIDPQLHGSKHADFQADAAMSLAKLLRKKPRDIAEEVAAALQGHPLIESVAVAGPGFLNINVPNSALEDHLTRLQNDPKLGVPDSQAQTVVVDYSSPNVAKEMHVGHLRSTIIGDACARLLSWRGHTVIRRNHIGDWGTPFGMLVEHLLDVGEAAATQVFSVGDLNTFYRQARAKFDADSDFQNRARSRVVLLQQADAETLRLWHILIEQSQKYFMHVYNQLDVLLDGSEFVGESSYNDDLQDVLEELRDKGLIVESDGAECVMPEGYVNREGEPLPLIVRKKDGGFGYAATDLAAIRQRTQTLHANRLIYVVGAPQSQHLQMVFAVARLAGWLQSPATAEHIAFGSVLGTDGKMLKTRAGDTVKLSALIDESIARAESKVKEKNTDLDSTESKTIARITGLGAIKYADLSSERIRDYVFDYSRMLAFEGNTAPYLQYAHTRIHSILKKAGEPSESPKIIIEHDQERQLALLLLRFPNVIAQLESSLAFHQLANYLFELATAFSSFYTHCPVLSPDDEKIRLSRLAQCRLVATVLSTGLGILGIRTPDRM